MPTTSTRLKPHFEQLRTWMREINGEKSAMAARGETTHPSKNVPDGTSKPTHGEQFEDNERYVKEHVPANVDDSREVGGDANARVGNISLKQSPTGEMPEVEDNYESRPKNVPTSHPADASIGPKYGFDLSNSDGLRKAAEALANLANEILADVAVGQTPEKKAEPEKKASPSQTGVETPASSTPVDSNLESAQAGYELAKLMGLSKEAADQAAVSVVSDTIKQALWLADEVGAFLVDTAKQAQAPVKKADDMPAGDAKGEMAGDAAGMPAPAEESPGGAAGMPGGEGAAGGGGPVNQEDALRLLAQLLMERGISPEQLEQMVASQGGGSGGPEGAPPGGGMPAGGPPPGSPAEAGAKIASAVRSYMRSGKFEVRPIKNAAEKRLRAEMNGYINEILATTRQ